MSGVSFFLPPVDGEGIPKGWDGWKHPNLRLSPLPVSQPLDHLPHQGEGGNLSCH